MPGKLMDEVQQQQLDNCADGGPIPPHWTISDVARIARDEILFLRDAVAVRNEQIKKLEHRVAVEWGAATNLKRQLDSMKASYTCKRIGELKQQVADQKEARRVAERRAYRIERRLYARGAEHADREQEAAERLRKTEAMLQEVVELNTRHQRQIAALKGHNARLVKARKSVAEAPPANDAPPGLLNRTLKMLRLSRRR